MAPKNKFTKQQLIDTAFDIANAEGFGNITIRKIADRLGSSIAPIYVNFKEVEELKKEVIKKVVGIHHELMEQQNFGSTFLNLGAASIILARKYPLLFEELMLKSSNSNQWFTDINPFALEQMRLQPSLSKFDDEELKMLLLKMQAFQIGLSVLAINKNYADTLTDEKMIGMLKDMGNMLVLDLADQKRSK